jgi:flavorubredoxin
VNTTRVDEIADRIYRISTPVPDPAPGFTFNQILVAADEPLLFHTGPRRLFEATRAAVARVLPPERLRWVGFSHFEADECGALNDWLSIAPRAVPVCSRVAKMVSVDDVADRPARALADGEALSLGSHEVAWIDAPHVPHGWECGFLFERRTRTFLCGDLFTQGGDSPAPLTRSDILEPSEAFRGVMDYYAHAPDTAARLRAMAAMEPRTLACMHGSAYDGDCSAILLALSERMGADAATR